jgi:HD-GYP domain-containing protein (c-di-GMP phosphodiesterase class II)
LKLSENEIRDIYVSSLLHDVGKIGIDDAILGKPGRLTDEEFEVIKTHTVLGAKIMEPIQQMEPIIPGLRHHHERCDGSGYPDGLTREQTPMMARIIAVADTFDAITTDRPYQDRMTFEVAVARINELKGQFLDAQVVVAFNNACVAGHIRLDREMETETIMIPPSQEEGDDVLANVDVIPAMPVSASDPGTGSAVE